MSPQALACVGTGWKPGLPENMGLGYYAADIPPGTACAPGKYGSGGGGKGPLTFSPLPQNILIPPSSAWFPRSLP